MSSDAYYKLMEDDAPQGCAAIQRLWSWSENYDSGKGPAALFLDLIGWSMDELGEPIYSLKDASLGYLELDMLAKALTEYAGRPIDCRDYVDSLLEAEMAE